MVFGILKFVDLDINSHYGFTSGQRLNFFFFSLSPRLTASLQKSSFIIMIIENRIKNSGCE